MESGEHLTYFLIIMVNLLTNRIEYECAATEDNIFDYRLVKNLTDGYNKQVLNFDFFFSKTNIH